MNEYRSDVEYNLLQPLDSLTAHTDESTTHRNTMVDKMEKNKISLEKELMQMTRELRDRNNEFQCNAMQILTLARDYARQRGKELPNYITIGEGGATCKCKICHIDIALNIYNNKTIYNIGKHTDGAKHKTAMLEFMKSQGQEFEVKNSTKPTSEPVPQSNFRATEEIAMSLREALKIDPNNVPQCSTPSEDKEVQKRIKSLSYFRIVKYGTPRCTLCHVEVPNNYCAIVGHLKGEKHAKSMQIGMELADCTSISRSGTRSSTLEDTKTLKPKLTVHLKIRRADVAINETDTNNNNDESRFLLSSAAKDEEVQRQVDISSCFRIADDHSVEQHVNSEDHKEVTVELTQFTDHKIKVEDTNNLTLVYPDTSDRFYKCLTCLLFIPNDTSSINRHNNGKRHQRQVKRLNVRVKNNLYLSQNNLNLLNCISFDKNRYSCSICDKLLPKDSLLVDHLNSRKHDLNITKSVVANNGNVDALSVVLPKYTKAALGDCLDTIGPQDALYYKKKSVNFENGTNRCIVNSKSIANIKQPRLKSEETELNWQEQMRDSKDHFMCDICSKSVPNCKDDISHHLRGRKHRSKIVLGPSKKLWPLELRKSDTKKSNSVISDEEKLQIYKFIELPDCSNIRGNGLAKCNLCVSEFPNNRRDINLHVNGKRHKQAIEVDTKFVPDVISVVENGKRSCTICLTKFANNCNSINYHLLSKKHKRMTSRGTLPSQLREGYRRKVASNDKKSRNAIELPDCISIKARNIAKCTVCVTDIPNKPSDINVHLNDRSHKDAIEVERNFQLNFNSVVKNGLRCCIPCRNKFPNDPKSLVSHMASKQHKKAIAATRPKK